MSGIAPGAWREAEAYQPILAGGRPALAWELLRRDEDYRNERHEKRTVQGLVVRASVECAARWGIHFRM